ncbi:hypothetical protein M5K25_022049 [Dendrobium thyrsiflorum]|uniref:Uncharacterized protein n=1 Tax=Dendrobium thyrsiflorum TaxID=117978 RepID=A0ABD0U5M0_DENTH
MTTGKEEEEVSGCSRWSRLGGIEWGGEIDGREEVQLQGRVEEEIGRAALLEFAGWSSSERGFFVSSLTKRIGDDRGAVAGYPGRGRFDVERTVTRRDFLRDLRRFGDARLIRDGAASDPAIFGLAGSGLLHPSRLQTRAMGNMPPNAEFSEVDSESPPRFTCSICDAMSGSDSPSSGKYRSSSELQSIGNTIMQASGASFLTYFSFIEVPGATEMTRHTSVGRKSVSPSSSVSPILSSDIKSASLMGFEELAWLRCCLEVDACTLGNPFRLSTGSLRNFSVFGSHLSPHLSSDVGKCDIFIIRMILFNFICFLFSLRTITSIGDGANLVNWISERRRHWISGSLFGRRISSTRGLRSKLTSSSGGVGERRDPLEDSPRRRHESSFGPISDDLDC